MEPSDASTASETADSDTARTSEKALSSHNDLFAQTPSVKSPTHFAFYALMHSWRTGGYLPWVLLGLRCYPRRVVLSMIIYYSLRWNTRWFPDAVQAFLRYAVSKEPRFLNASTQPYDRNKQYLIAAHPHGILCDCWFNLHARIYGRFDDGCPLLNGVRLSLCVAPAACFFPFTEIANEHMHDATAKTIRRILRETPRSPVVAPGGFSEAVYTGTQNYDVSFLLQRKGFIRLAIEHGVDIIPTYTFGYSQAYRVWDWKLQERAELAQKIGMPLVVWRGKYGTNIPFSEDLCLVSFDVFPTSTYTIDQVDQAHADYLCYLKTCFDKYKYTTKASKDLELVFAGRGHPPSRL